MSAAGLVLRVIVFGGLLLALSPLLLALALWVRLDSPGPALFLQQRLGKGRVPFRIAKFRTMKYRAPDSIDQVREAVLAGADSRVTRAGRFLRRTSLDELPQLWNMFVGDMNLVGPRPLLPEQLAAIPATYLRRFDVRPGLTGLAQVRGRRSLDWLDQLKADTEYVERRSIGTDLRILMQTVRVVLTGEGVYDPKARNWREFLPKDGKH